MRKALVGLLVALIAGSALAGPKTKHVPRLKVTRFLPRHEQMLVPVDARIAVRFNRPLDPASVTPKTAQFMKLSGERLAVTYSFDKKNRTLYMTPVDRLSGSTDYKVLVRPGLFSKEPHSRPARTLVEDRHAQFYTKSVPPRYALLSPDQFETVQSPMVEGRAAHSAVTMWNHRVLLAAGMTDYTAYAVSGDVFDPESKTFQPSGGQIRDQRAFAPGVEFEGGAMLVGGSSATGALATTEVYVAALHTFQPGPTLLEKRDFVAAVTLKDGRVLVVGGLDYFGPYALYSLTAEIYDPAAGGFRLTAGAPIGRRSGHTATLLPDGRVFITGGQSGGESTPVISEIFDPETETFTITNFGSQYHRSLHTAIGVGDVGGVLLADGGSSLFEYFDPATQQFHPAGASSTVNRFGATASRLPDGSVLIAGGIQNNGDGNVFMLDSFDLWKPEAGDYGGVFRPDVIFTEPRYGHSATTLHDGRVLFAGGFGPGGPDSLRTGVVFTPAPVVPK